MNLFNLFGGQDPNQLAYQEWLKKRGGVGIPQKQDFGTFDPSLSYDTQQKFDQAGYDEAMQKYDWKKRFSDMQNNRFMASLANAFAPKYPKQPRAIVAGPQARAWVPNPPMRYWS